MIGDPAAHAAKYYEHGADELIYMDIVASLYARDHLIEIIHKTARDVFIPITAVASIYGMNLVDIPLMKSRSGFYIVASVMVASVGAMLVYFRRKKWM